MNLSSLLEMVHKNIFAIVLVAATSVVILMHSGLEKTLLLGLVIASAYFNAIFLRAPLMSYREPSTKSLTIFLGMLGANIALFLLLRFDSLVLFLVWVPAVTGVVVSNFMGRIANKKSKHQIRKSKKGR